MKYEWEYPFTSSTLIFDDVVKYNIELHNKNSKKVIQSIIKLKSQVSENNKINTSGTMSVSIPFDMNKGTPIAHQLAQDFEQKMAFEFGDFNIGWELLFCKRIPETKEEKEKVGNSPYLILRLALQTVPEKKVLDQKNINEHALPIYNQVLLKLFNYAESKHDVIDKFSTRFKIIETEFIDNESRISAKKQFKSATTLRDIFYSIAIKQSQNISSYNEFIDRIVDSRGECAHLKKYKYGYLPDDYRLKKLESLERELRELCKALIKF